MCACEPVREPVCECVCESVCVTEMCLYLALPGFGSGSGDAGQIEGEGTVTVKRREEGTGGD